MKIYLNTCVAVALLVFSSNSFAQVQMPDDQTQEQIFNEPSSEALEAADYIDSLGFVDPETDGDAVEEKTSRKALTGSRSVFETDPKGLIPANLRKEALAYYSANSKKITNKRYLSVVDFSANASKARFFIIDMNTGSVSAFHVAHGSGSDKNNDGYAESFSNKSGSNASSLGYYLAAETYNGKHGLSLRLDGLSSTNSAARARAVVIHGASYVSDKDVKAGRSWGCLAVSEANRTKVVNMLKGGSLIYAGLSK